MKLTTPAHRDRVIELLVRYGYELNYPADTDSLMQAMERDKKRRTGRMRFVLQRDLRDTEVRGDVERSVLRRTLLEKL